MMADVNPTPIVSVNNNNNNPWNSKYDDYPHTSDTIEKRLTANP